MATSLAQLEQFKQVDQQRLKTLLSELDQYIRLLMTEKIGKKIQQNDFLKQLRLQLSNPGGPCTHKSPSYQLWLQSPAETRIKHLQTWRQEFMALENIVYLILKITRESAQSQIIRCDNGFYHQTLDPALPCELVRIGIDADLQIFPEISAGKHRLSIRLMQPNFLGNGKASQVLRPEKIELICCRV